MFVVFEVGGKILAVFFNNIVTTVIFKMAFSNPFSNLLQQFKIKPFLNVIYYSRKTADLNRISFYGLERQSESISLKRYVNIGECFQ